MDSSFNYNCWEILNCKNLDCLARFEPETPCWEIAQRNGTYQNTSNTCKDCVAYIFNEKKASLSRKQLQNIRNKWALLPNTRISHQVCINKHPPMARNIDRNNYHFLLHDFIGRKVFLNNTWCDQCDGANLAIFNQTELEIDGSKFTLGYCRRCNSKILSEVIEKNVIM